jgi:APA family basic amino acid/polyamine antiporter
MLLRILGVAFGIAIIIGSTIGAGILRTPGAVVAQVGSVPLALALWTFGGVYALLGATALADLATSLPRSGGFYVYARRALGRDAGFVVGCADWFSNTAFTAYGAITIADYATLLGSRHGAAIGAAAIVAFAAVQLFGMRVSSHVQEVTSFVKASAFVALVLALLLFAPAATGATAPAHIAGPSMVAILLAIQLVIGAYDGWQGAMYFAGEDRDPERNLARAFVGGVLVVMAVYLMVNVALFRALPVSTLAASALPAADAATLVFGASAGVIITALSLGSLLPLINALLLTSTRVVYAMAQDGLMPRRLGTATAGGTPAAALVLSAIVSLAFIATGTFDAIASVAAFFSVFGYGGAFLSLLVLRRREPDLPRPFRAWGYPWTTIAVLCGAVAFLAGVAMSAPREGAIAFVALALTYAVAAAFRRAGPPAGTSAAYPGSATPN